MLFPFLFGYDTMNIDNKSGGTMDFWDDVPSALRVELFGTSHLIFMVSVFLFIGLFVWKLNFVKKHWNVVRIVMIVLSMVQVVVLYSWSIVELGFNLEAGLPIHMCRMATFLGLYFLITEDKRVFHALYYMSVFAVIAIVYPVNVHPIYTHIIGYSYQISHMMILLVWIIGVCLYGYRPTYKVLHITTVWFFVIELFVWRFNYWVGDGEYLYLRSDVNRPFLKDWPDMTWILFTVVVAYLVMLLMTFALVGKGRGRYELDDVGK